MLTLALPTLGYTSSGRRLTAANSDPCIYCSEPVEMNATSAGRGKMAHLKCKRANSPRTAPAVCQGCGSPFQSVKRSDGRWTECCSKSCARRREVDKGSNTLRIVRLADDERDKRAFARGEEARRKRRARLLEVPRDPYTTASIAERDECICGLCGGLVDLTLQWPAPQSASVDHILPLSRGGDDTLKNVQLAHLACNLGKNNRI